MHQRKKKVTEKFSCAKKGKTADKVSYVKERKNFWQNVMPQKYI